MSSEAGSDVPERLLREVAASAAEFERALRLAWPDGVERIGGGAFLLRNGPLCLRIRIRPDGVRRIGLLELPRLAVSYAFEGADATARARMLARLDLGMRRGGG